MCMWLKQHTVSAKILVTRPSSTWRNVPIFRPPALHFASRLLYRWFWVLVSRPECDADILKRWHYEGFQLNTDNIHDCGVFLNPLKCVGYVQQAESCHCHSWNTRHVRHCCSLVERVILETIKKESDTYSREQVTFLLFFLTLQCKLLQRRRVERVSPPTWCKVGKSRWMYP